MTAKITFEVENCADCPFHERHQIYTPDSFEREFGIYCSQTEEPNQEEWTKHSYDGEISKRLVACDDKNPKKYAKVPDWCPFILKQYAILVSEICESYNWESYMRANIENPRCLKSLAFGCGTKHAQNTIKYAKTFLDELSKNSFKDFLYSEECHSVERDKYLMSIVTLLRLVGAHEFSGHQTGPERTKIAKSEFLDHSGLSLEDQCLIVDGILNWDDIGNTIEQFDKLKECSKVHRKKPILDTGTAIKISLFLASMLDIGPDRITPSTYDLRGHEREIRPLADAFKKVEKAEFKFIYNEHLGKINGFSPKNAAELHYTVEDGFDVKAFKLAPGYILWPRTIAKEFLGFRSFKFFVNDKEIDTRRFEEKR